MKELGFKQESFFCHFQFRYPDKGIRGILQHSIITKDQLKKMQNDGHHDYSSWLSAYLSDEIAEMLPDGCSVYRRGKSWFALMDGEKQAIGVAMESQVGAWAALAIYLKEQGII